MYELRGRHLPSIYWLFELHRLRARHISSSYRWSFDSNLFKLLIRHLFGSFLDGLHCLLCWDFPIDHGFDGVHELPSRNILCGIECNGCIDLRELQSWYLRCCLGGRMFSLRCGYDPGKRRGFGLYIMCPSLICRCFRVKLMH